VDEAKQAHASGDTKKCIEITSKVVERLDKTNKGSGSSSGGA